MMTRYLSLANMRTDFPRWCLRVFSSLLLISAVAYLFSITFIPVRLLYLVTLGWGLCTGALYLCRLSKRRPWIPAIMVLAVALIIVWFARGNTFLNSASLGEQYLARLTAFQGTRYIWGGETHIGIDCSGLARIALVESLLVEGVRTGNPRLLGPDLWRFWWRDMSAQAMGEGTYGYTRVVGKAKKLAGADLSAIEVGDLAIASRGTHVLIYVGDNRWIEANPSDGRVVINMATTDSPRAYFNVPVTIVRWWVLDREGK